MARALEPVDDPPPTREQPHDLAAEQALLAHALARPETIADLDVDAGDFYHHDHQTIWSTALQLHTAGVTPDVVALVDQLRRDGHVTSRKRLDVTALALLDTPPVGDPAHYVRLLHEHTRRRRTITLAQALEQAAWAPSSDIDTAAARALDSIMAVSEHRTGPGLLRAAPPDIDAFLNSPEPVHDWLIPGFLERQDRLILTAGEGHGKSMLLRQWAVQAAAGIHPFTYELIDPITVLHLDLENSTRQNRREYRPLRIKAGTNLDPARLYLEHRIDGVDLTQPEDRTWVDQLIAQVKPGLLITGPVYKMANGDPTEEKSAKPVAMYLDHLRATHGVAVMLEAHSSKALGGAKKRAHEPYGWSGWLRWPEFGIWLDEDGALTPWRGQRDAARTLPVALTRGGTWPWTVVHDEDELKWQRIRQAITVAGKNLSQRELQIATSIPRTTIQRVLTKKAVAHIYLLAELGLETPDDDDD